MLVDQQLRLVLVVDSCSCCVCCSCCIVVEELGQQHVEQKLSVRYRYLRMIFKKQIVNTRLMVFFIAFNLRIVPSLIIAAIITIATSFTSSVLLRLLSLVLLLWLILCLGNWLWWCCWGYWQMSSSCNKSN